MTEPAGPDGTDEVARRLREALRAEAAAVRPDEDAGLDAIRRRGRAALTRRRAVLAGVGVAAIVAVAVGIPLARDDGHRTVTTGSPQRSTLAPPTSGPPNETARGTTPFRRPPLWPFRTAAEVEEWQVSHREHGNQPWHLDAEQTALSFTTGFLGFTEIDRVVTSQVGATDAYVTVGYAHPDGGLSPAANVHLMRWGTGDDAPWEVVGTEDETLTLDEPPYGAHVTSPLTVGGEITGVDESLRVRVLQPSSAAPLGEACCVPAGGERQRWQATVAFTGATDPAQTVVAWTGGHVQEVERFAITAIRV